GLGESRILEHRQSSREDGRGCRWASERGNIDGMAVEQTRAVVERPLDGAPLEGHPGSGASGTYCPYGWAGFWCHITDTSAPGERMDSHEGVSWQSTQHPVPTVRSSPSKHGTRTTSAASGCRRRTATTSRTSLP